jgi:hypothetical protein
MSGVEHYRRFDWKAVKAKNVREGDLWANGATVTSVVVGPAEAPGESDSMQPTKGKVLIRCGSSFASLRDKGAGVVVGRNFKPPPADPPVQPWDEARKTPHAWVGATAEGFCEACGHGPNWGGHLDFEAPPVQPEPAAAPTASEVLALNTAEMTPDQARRYQASTAFVYDCDAAGVETAWVPFDGVLGTSDEALAHLRAEEGRDEPEPGAWKVGDRFTIVDAEGELHVTKGREYVVIPPVHRTSSALVWCYDDANDLHAFFPRQIERAAGPVPVPVDPPQPEHVFNGPLDRVANGDVAVCVVCRSTRADGNHIARLTTPHAFDRQGNRSYCRLCGRIRSHDLHASSPVDPPAETVDYGRIAAEAWASRLDLDVDEMLEGTDALIDWGYAAEAVIDAYRAALGVDQ